MANRPRHSILRPAGYAALIEQYALAALPNWHVSFVGATTRRLEASDGTLEEFYPGRYWPGDALGAQLEFAFKYDGVNLGILAQLFKRVQPQELVEYIQSKPSGKTARRIWFLYEWLTKKSLPIEDATRGNYVDLLDPELHYTVSTPQMSRRHRVRNNLLGTQAFCPQVRRTLRLEKFEASDLTQRCQAVLDEFAPDLLRRALGFLYTRETRSSFAIEHIQPDSSRTERFVTLLQNAGREDLCSKSQLIYLQNNTVDPRFCDSDYRTTQNYVGQSIGWRERVHFVSPKPEDLEALMQGLIECHQQLRGGLDSAVVHAAVVSFGFVYLHPFEDGNGRIHRLLIHNILAQRGFTPPGFIFPVSAIMKSAPEDYDAALEAFSAPLMRLIDFDLDAQGQMEVHSETASLFRYIDLTHQTESLFDFITRTIETELVAELTFLERYDRSVEAIQNIVDMPNRLLDLLIRCCRQNDWKLSARKRASHFELLTDEEVARVEVALASINATPNPPPAD